MAIVIDTSVIISVITNENNKAKLIKATDANELIAPLSLHWEIGNAVSAMFKRNRINLIQSKQALLSYKKIPLKLIDVSLIGSLEIANELNIYAYDAYFIFCAKDLNLPLLSLDNSLLAAAKKNGIKIIEV